MKASVMLAALIKLKHLLNEDEHNWNDGICDNIQLFLEDDFGTVNSYLTPAFKQWSEYSGNMRYPVPSPSGKSPEEEFFHAHNLWGGKYGESRKRLLDFLIVYYTDEAVWEKGE